VIEVASQPGLAASPNGCELEKAERCAQFLIDGAVAKVGKKAWQGRWDCPFPMPKGSPALAELAKRRIYRVPFRAIRSLCAWANGCRLQLLEHVPSDRHVLDLQSWGSRCVSLLATSDPTRYPEHPLDFCVHDLCHLDKFLEPPLYAEQVGFFSSLQAVLDNAQWRRIESDLDDEWIAGRGRVAADMNGSPIYLFAMLKMQLKLAARRSEARMPGDERDGVHELSRIAALEDGLLRALNWHGELKLAGQEISARRDSPSSALLLRQHFARLGEIILGRGRQHLRWQSVYENMKLPGEMVCGAESCHSTGNHSTGNHERTFSLD
jgi:hypothetical protein